jgi:hypothetical protein
MSFHEKPFSLIQNSVYTEGSFDFGFMMSDFGAYPTSDTQNPKYTEGSFFA